jgi:hypothetical protein
MSFICIGREGEEKESERQEECDERMRGEAHE